MSAKCIPPNRPRSLHKLGCMIAACSLAPVALAADNPGAHEHGHARLQMAVEENRIDLMLNSPAYNLAGFEHGARTDAEKSRLADISRWLETTPLINTAAADCRVTAAAVELGGEEENHDGDTHHEDGHHDEEHHGEATHREYDVSQQLECNRIDADQEFTSALMERFEGMAELTIEWVSPSGQGSARLTPSNRAFTVNN
ncbi:DUF2796 domain-containing protein [Marinobacter sp.]|jgi:uncharacterized protein DUF2796|uniref:DUF2796 domain-containing protein n=1 Tax=Marinobacter sp. TaxID=50741 RepID=UPI000C1189CF|nr:DUF2796 domain-containing protein [Marinobacter sp.]MBE95501.1 metal ABC transporter substrate-binding protein [Marinobacter sp.]MBP55857.1 metal ABC transporter substrate-binding protein [Marinobacter sp.]PHQ75238.1 MAG: metal ABC transporter substrate-binding protein [Marinobacter sp.]